MIKINNSIIHLNFEVQHDKHNRPFRQSATTSLSSGNTKHTFRRLDSKSDYFYIEVDRWGNYVNFKEKY